MKLFSVIIPVKGKFKKQTFPTDCEVIYVKKFKKSEARNYGAKIAKGRFLIHIDKDNVIKDDIFIQIRKLIKKGAKSIVLEEFIDNPKTIWQKARSLERKILAGNKILATPQIIEKKLFEKVGGYDERFNELDDWSLWMRLGPTSPRLRGAKTIKKATIVFEPTNVIEILKRRFKKGQELKYFNEVYGSIPQISSKNILDLYFKNLPTIPLLILKFFDYLGLFFGSLFPIRPNLDELYKDKLIAKNFNKVQLSIYGKIKDFFEKRAILNLIEGKKILDLGAGTGRLTKFLFEKDYSVQPCDVSEAMLSQFPKNLPKPVLIKSERLPFKNSSFDTVFSMRVIWHIKDDVRREKFFAEAVRVSTKNIIIDFSFFSSPSDHQFNWTEIKKLAKKYRLKIKNYHYLPLGRFLIKFEKI